MVKELGKELIDWLHQKDRCYVSTLAYSICAILIFLSIASIISPFSISLSFIDSIEWRFNLINSTPLVRIALIIDVLSFASSIITNVASRRFKNLKNSNYKEICATFHTGDDIVDLFAAIFSLFFMLSVFLQMYKTQVFFVTFKSLAIYIFIVYKMLSNMWYVFKYRNLSVINKVLEKYNDLD